MPRLAAAAGLAALAIGLVWVKRIDLAHRLIDRQIRALKLSARYRIDEIGTGREVLGDISIGDPANPDLTIKTLEIDTGWQGGLPAIIRLKLVGTRLRGRASDGHLSFGSLDPLLFGPAPAPFRLPDMALTLRDAQASIAGDQGPIGLAIAGSGNLRDGFSGTLAMVAPALRGGGCVGEQAHFHGQLAIHAEQPRVTGPLRLAQLTCPGMALAVQAPVLQLALQADPAWDGGMAHFGLVTAATRLGSLSASRLAGAGAASLRHGVIAGDFALGGDGVHAPSARAVRLGIQGHFRATPARGAFTGEGTLSGRGIGPDSAALATLARAQTAGAGTMAEPLLAGVRSSIFGEAGASWLSGSWIARRSASGTSLVLPELHLDGANTGRWLSLTRIMLKQAAGPGPLAVSGDFAMAGTGLPQASGRITSLANGAGAVSLSIPAWRAAATSLAVPNFALRWDRAGRAAFTGLAVVSGPLPGGQITGLAMPLAGSWSPGKRLLLGNRCAVVRFERLALGGVDFAPAVFPLCPGSGADAMVALGGSDARVAVRSAGLKLAGRMQGADVRLATGAVALGWPGALSARDVELSMTGPSAASLDARPASRLRLAQLSASLGAGITGHFGGGDVTLAASPAVLRDASGDFDWASGRLTVQRAQFRLEAPASHSAFAPIVGNGATVSLAHGLITATASLQTLTASRELAHLAIAHDLASGRGHADVVMPGLVFDKGLQPRQLSALTEGVIADARGTLRGHGRFDWDHGQFTSSGAISTTGFDFAAAFGPVKGVAGTITFTDLLGLVTAPDQTLAIAAINPGIEVNDGVLTFALQPGRVLAVTGAQWPFLDGRLALLPTRLVLGATEVRRFELRVDGLNAAKFLARIELSNLAATGTFDGNLPLVFDESGGRIENGLLLSRPPGGTVSYVGALTYKDLSPMANYAFQALRALKYRQMRIGMAGLLAGDMVTHVSMQGVGQGQGARRNLITNQIARLPIRFDVTVTAPFMQLVTSFRSLYDPALVADPRTLGLIDAHGKPIAHPSASNLPAAKLPPAPTPPAIQP